ncbi:MAG: PpiC-type peptidyl-prolyl cis-trans isomerase [Methylocystaceae bacterium]|nr:MAG: PpiC-type peptidyl-prolyl cis-trans isomerase [Methylocystaceae bacterium]KAF0211248.1 MAG: PpiC-type peptidyl-prolyl cis-trans [Methylocystaceae bacterium]TXT45438.1 MAG: PpiC-type peptidyl-prolyl cis-trans isomerase [Methylocystaceae bacterium]
MLEGLRVASQNWIGRTIMALVMGVIVISFSIWGVGDVFRGMTAQRLARVGSGEVTVETYRSAYQNELRRIQQRMRRAITNEEAHQAGLDLQILERLVTEVALDQKARQLGLAASDETTQRLLASEKVFQGPDGKFDAMRFKQIANDSGFTERGFVADQKNAYLRKMITDIAVAGVEPPKLMVEAIYRFRNESRTIDYVILPPSLAGAAATPSDEELKKYFDEREQTFRAKEYRKLTALVVSPSTLGKPESVPAEQARKLYDEVKSKRYGMPEKRDVRQIVFKTDTEAEAALAKLKAGADIEAMAAELKLNPKDVNLGLVEQRDFGDPKVGAAVFALPSPGLTEPVHTAFGAVVSQVRSIAPAVYNKTFEQAEPELRAEIAAQGAMPEVRRLHEAIEDQRASGKTLAESAKAVGLETQVYDGVDDAGNDRSGKPIAGLPSGPDLVKAAFASDIGVDNDTVATRDGGYVWYEVNGIEPARQKTFEEVKAAVVDAMRSDAAQKALAAKADEIVAKLNAGRSIEDVAKEVGVQTQRANDVKREARPDFNTNVIVRFFDVAPRNAGSAVVDNGRLVFFVRDSTTPVFDPSSIEAKTIAQQLKPAFHNDLLEQYVGGLEKALGVDINQKALEAATGAERDK